MTVTTDAPQGEYTIELTPIGGGGVTDTETAMVEEGSTLSPIPL